MAFDEQRFYCINRWRSIVTLRAISLADGAPAWSCEWAGPEDSSWSIALSAQHVIAYPNHTGLADGSEMETIPVIVRRRETGALVQRFLFPATLTEPSPRGDPGGAPGDAAGRRDVQDRPGRSLGGDAAGACGASEPRGPTPPVRRRRGRLDEVSRRPRRGGAFRTGGRNPRHRSKPGFHGRPSVRRLRDLQGSPTARIRRHTRERLDTRRIPAQ